MSLFFILGISHLLVLYIHWGPRSPSLSRHPKPTPCVVQIQPRARTLPPSGHAFLVPKPSGVPKFTAVSTAAPTSLGGRGWRLLGRATAARRSLRRFPHRRWLLRRCGRRWRNRRSCRWGYRERRFSTLVSQREGSSAGVVCVCLCLCLVVLRLICPFLNGYIYVAMYSLILASFFVWAVGHEQHGGVGSTAVLRSTGTWFCCFFVSHEHLVVNPPPRNTHASVWSAITVARLRQRQGFVRKEDIPSLHR